MQRFTVLIMTDQTSPVRRFQVQRITLQRAAVGAAVVVLLLVAGLFDYSSKWMENSELDSLRLETLSQREQLYGLESSIADTEERLERLGQLERKLRVITNLPGSEELSTGGGMGGGIDEGALPFSEPLVDPSVMKTLDNQGTPHTDDINTSSTEGVKKDEASRLASLSAARMARLRLDSERLERDAAAREVALASLVDHLQGQSKRLESTPSVWPVKGWLTSRFGPRVSPFTGQRQFHSGIDIAAENGAAVISPAQGKVVYSGRKRLLGNTIILDHGFGIRTTYGHNAKLHVQKGEHVERGDLLASVGTTGRSTGPHLHYSLTVDDRAVNPLDYILD
jgi:murein DD-endopeptidase MepM/ murein hydrolase activator NlpD